MAKHKPVLKGWCYLCQKPLFDLDKITVKEGRGNIVMICSACEEILKMAKSVE